MSGRWTSYFPLLTEGWQKLFAREGLPVVALEPDDAMAEVLARRVTQFPDVQVVRGSEGMAGWWRRSVSRKQTLLLQLQVLEGVLHVVHIRLAGMVYESRLVEALRLCGLDDLERCHMGAELP